MSITAQDYLSPVAQKRLRKELQQLENENDFNIRAKVMVDSEGNQDLSRWELTLDGPPGTLFEGYKLKARMTFPARYPNLPPTFVFISKIWHPNVYADGKVCISILHSADEQHFDNYITDYSWTAVQTVRTVCISIISMLGDPNINSPANVDASKMFREDKPAYAKKVKQFLDNETT